MTIPPLTILMAIKQKPIFYQEKEQRIRKSSEELKISGPKCFLEIIFEKDGQENEANKIQNTFLRERQRNKKIREKKVKVPIRPILEGLNANK